MVTKQITYKEKKYYVAFFHRAIDSDGKTPSTRIAEIAECPLEPYSDLLQCLRTIDAAKLIEAYKTFWVLFPPKICFLLKSKVSVIFI